MNLGNMSKITEVILKVVDDDIADVFSKTDPQVYPQLLPIHCHIARHLAIISSKLCPDKQPKCKCCHNNCDDGENNV